MKVTLIDHMGTDLTVVNAARVSFNKKSSWKIITEDPKTGRGTYDEVLSEKDENLIKYLAEHNHWTPFGHPQIQIHVKAPIFVARQIVKHQVGLVWNEVSRRYVSDDPEFYNFKEFRLKAKDKKQGSSEDISTNNEYFQEYQQRVNDFCTQAYEQALGEGICEEQARVFLPINMYSEWHWTGSLAAFARVCNLRQSPDSQKETKIIADQIADIIKELFPVSSKYLFHSK